MYIVVYELYTNNIIITSKYHVYKSDVDIDVDRGCWSIGAPTTFLL